MTDYTREAGVRQLERELGTMLRKTATRIASEHQPLPIVIDTAAVRGALGRAKVFHEAAVRTAVPGVATGLAVTGTGGDVLFVEAASMPGSGGMVLTGQLGDVMKESARIALTYVKSHAAELGIDPNALEGREVHVHVPAGAIPKDGPSAGVTMVTAIASLLTNRPVKGTVGMTGEVTLQGRVLPIGGLKQKVLAAHAAGLTEVIVPERNAADLDDVPRDVREQMRSTWSVRSRRCWRWRSNRRPWRPRRKRSLKVLGSRFGVRGSGSRFKEFKVQGSCRIRYQSASTSLLNLNLEPRTSNPRTSNPNLEPEPEPRTSNPQNLEPRTISAPVSTPGSLPPTGCR